MNQRHAATWIAVAAVPLSALGGVVWGLLAPAQEYLVVAKGRGAALPGESTHQFDALGLFLCIAGVIGALVAWAAWQRRTVRGPVTAAGAVLGTGLGACAMAIVGNQVALMRHPRLDNPPLRQVITIAPKLNVLESGAAWIVVGAAPFAAALVFIVLAMMSPHDDLGSGVRQAAPERRLEPVPESVP